MAKFRETSKDSTIREARMFCEPIVKRYDDEMKSNDRVTKAFETLMASGLTETQIDALSDLITSAHYCGKYIG